MQYIFSVISLLGGLAMFLYGMRLMGSNLKEGSSGTLKVVMSKVTDSYVKAFLLGIAVTAIIQSSTATIVITSGLVAAGIITLDQSLGIIIGANVGTTVTGQIIRLLDVEAESGSILRFFQPSTLAPLALIIGVALIMFCKFSKSDRIGGIAVGFGILFSGLLNMTASVNDFANGGFIEKVFTSMGDNPLLGYISGAGVAFILQSSSATIGILQAFSMAWGIPFKTIYIVLVGIYLGDCVTTAIVCSIGANPESKRVGIINILYNLSKTVLVVAVVTIVHRMGLLDNLWTRPLSSGGIANTNTVFNLGCAVVLLPFVQAHKKLAMRIVKDDTKETNKYAEKISALNPVFFSMPAIALNSCYDVLSTMQTSSYESIDKAFDLISEFNEDTFKEILDEEENIDMLTDKVDNYLVQMSPHITEDHFIHILTQYHKLVSEFEHLGDYAVHIAETAKEMHDEDIQLSSMALKELSLIRLLLSSIMDYAKQTFEKRDVDAALHIEPLEEVMDDLANTLHDNHLKRLREGQCSVRAGILFLEILTNASRISDTCSNVGISTIVRVHPERAKLAHSYISSLHQGDDEKYNEEYQKAHNLYFRQLTE
ncbi:MAG: Na/Pi cotransporter family protein [Lachnospiraceae bacterium]|nr:Na/Pi cotransporter family protein [Lachnospiraceae bacterium]